MNKTSAPGWESLATRMKWLVETKFGNNKSAMGKAIGMTHVAVSRAVTGETVPSTRMTSLVVQKLGVNAAWLLHGQGEPFSQQDNRKAVRSGTPISNVLLAGVPQTQQSQLSSATLNVVGMLSPTQYWFRVTGGSPLLSRTGRGFQVGDLLLMEADRNLFPPQTTFWERLSVVKMGTEKKPKCVLADVTYIEASVDQGEERLEAEVLELDSQAATVEEIVLSRTDDGEFKIRQRMSKPTRAQVHEKLAIAKPPSKITAKQIVGVWTGMIYRTN